MIYLVDTNVLLRWTDADNPRHHECVGAVSRLIEDGHELYSCAQVLIEYWVSATRPRDVNGFGLSILETRSNESLIVHAFTCLPEPTDIAARWLSVVSEYSVLGRQAHDARIVALMQAHGVSQILTLNVSDFTRYQGITPISPSDVLSL